MNELSNIRRFWSAALVRGFPFGRAGGATDTRFLVSEIQSGAAVPHSKTLARVWWLLSLTCVLTAASQSRGGEAWQQALAAMPLGEAPAELNRTNCVRIFLAAFRPNSTVKALVFMPGATDEFYLFRRVKAALTTSKPTLLDGVTALTNHTFIHATFRSPFLLLHTEEDPLEPANAIQDPKTAERLKTKVLVPQLNCNDWDWDALQPVLKKSLKIALRPWRYSRDSWHFYRHSLAAWNVNGLEALELAALAGKSRFTLRHRVAVFEVDARVLAAPKFDAHLR